VVEFEEIFEGDQNNQNVVREEDTTMNREVA